MVQELLRRCRKVPFPWMEAKALQALGQLHAAQNEPTQALKAYQQALTICTRLGERLYAEQIECAQGELTQHP
jgi:hypothetical protein